MRSTGDELASTMPDKAEEMKLQLMETWKDLGTERPDEWWNTERNKPARSGTPTY